MAGTGADSALSGRACARSLCSSVSGGSPLLVCLQRAPPVLPQPLQEGPAPRAQGDQLPLYQAPCGSHFPVPPTPGWLASLKSTRLTSILAGQGTGTYRDIRVC